MFKLRAELQRDWELSAALDSRLSGPRFDAVVDRIHKHLRKVMYGVLRDSVIDLADTLLTEARLSETIWRIAGNQSSLRKGKAVPVWVNQSTTEWMPLQITSVKRVRRFDKVGVKVRARVLAGSAAGLMTECHWSPAFCRFLSAQLGFSKPLQQMPYDHPLDLVSLRLFGLFTPEICTGKPAFDKVHVSDLLRTYNKRMIKGRTRALSTCQFGHGHDCRVCHVGYCECPFGVHARTYVHSLCDICGQQAWHDKSEGGNVCVDCAQAALLRN